MAAAISIVHAASEQPHRIKREPGDWFTGAMAAAVTPERCHLVTLLDIRAYYVLCP